MYEVEPSDLVYCDPPYLGRHVDYFDSWSEEEEHDLYKLVTKNGSPFIMSTWLKNRYRVNDYVFSLWGENSIQTKEHFYHVGAKESNRNAVCEALLVNFDTDTSTRINRFDIDALAVQESISVVETEPKFPLAV